MGLDRLLLRQAGLVALRQVAAHGVPPRTVQRWAAERGWRRLHPGVYLAAGHCCSDEVRIHAAWLWGGDDATVSGPAAAYWLGMSTSAPDVVELTVPARCSPRSRPGVRIRRSDLGRVDRIRHRGIQLTAAPLTALETAVALPGGPAFLDRALQRHVGFPDVYRAHCRRIGLGGRSRAAGQLLVAAADGAESAAERLLVRLLREARIRGWVLGHPHGEFRIDLAFPAAKVAVEVDGWAWHVDVARFRGDRRKGNALVADGWTLLRFTWHDLTTEPARVVAQITHALRRAA